MSSSFAGLGVSAAMADALAARGIERPFPIQRLVIGDVLAGRDVLARSPTGSGKTLAFALPLADRIEPGAERPAALCWVSSEGDIGPAVGEAAGDLVPVVMAALDRVAKSREPETLGVYVTTLSWWLIRRLRRLGFQVFWPSWVMCSVPLPGLDRYAPTRPPHVL
jgi:hypothetical protein